MKFIAENQVSDIDTLKTLTIKRIHQQEKVYKINIQSIIELCNTFKHKMSLGGWKVSS